MTSLKTGLLTKINRVQRLSQTIDERLGLIERAARGELGHEWDSNVKLALSEVIAVYKDIEGVGNRNFDESFFKSEEGQTIARAQKWLMGDDLIVLPDAAILLGILKDSERDTYGSKNSAARVKMNNRIRPQYGEKPKLTLYYDPDSRYPFRVSRAEVLALVAGKAKK